jgi:hypothetical protein
MTGENYNRFIIKATKDDPNYPIGMMLSVYCERTGIPKGWIESLGQGIEELLDYPDLVKFLEESGSSSIPDGRSFVYPFKGRLKGRLSTD